MWIYARRADRFRRQLALPLVAIVFLLAVGAAKPPRVRRVAKVADEQPGLSFAFVEVPNGVSMLGAGSSSGIVEVGPVSRSGAEEPNVRVRPATNGLVFATHFGIIVHDGSGSGRTASLMAALPMRLRGTVVRLDGMTLDTTGRIVAAHLVPETITAHRLEIEVSNDVTEANNKLLNSVLFTVLPE